MKQKIENIVDNMTLQELRAELKESGATIPEYFCLTEDDIEAGKAKLDPVVREKLEGVCSRAN